MCSAFPALVTRVSDVTVTSLNGFLQSGRIISDQNVRRRLGPECRLLAQKAPSVAFPAKGVASSSQWRRLRATREDVELRDIRTALRRKGTKKYRIWYRIVR